MIPISVKLLKNPQTQQFLSNSLRLIEKQQCRHFSAGCAGESPICTKGLVLGLYKPDNDCEKAKLTSHGEHYDSEHGGILTKLIGGTGLTGDLGQYRLFNGIDREFGQICVVGLGDEGIGYSELEALERGFENARVAAGVGAKQLRDNGCTVIHVDPMEYPEQAAEGSALAIWRYQENKCKKDRLPVPRLELYDSAEIDEWTRGLFKADAQNLARTLCDAPSNQLTPTAFAQTAVDALCPCGVVVDVRNTDWIEQNNLQSFLTVAKSSCEHPIMLEIRYCGDPKDDKPILLAGSGITFNSGGLCLKPSKGMSEFRASMAGAAAVVATIRAAAALSLPINLVGIVPLCENMPSGMAFKPGNIINTMDGKSIGIHSTNLAHRLVLADPILYGQNTFKPRLVIDIATFTRGVGHGLSGGASGVYSNSNFIWQQIRKAGVLTGDRVWLLPSWQYFTSKVRDYKNVDLSNVGRGTGVSCLGAAFMREFVPCVDWLHLDITGSGMKKKCHGIPYLEHGRMTGRPVRTLIQFLHQIACPEEGKRELEC